MTPPVLTTERLTLRGPREADFERFAAFYATDRSCHIGGPLAPYAAWTVFAGDIGHWQMKGFGFWSVDFGDEYVGTVGIHYPPHHADLELGWSVFAHAEGKGIAREAAEAARGWAYASLPPQRLVSYIANDNDRSIRLAERMGAVRESAAPAHDLNSGTWLHPVPA